MNRRDLIKSLIGAGLAHTLDVERLLWVPHSKAIFIPPPSLLMMTNNPANYPPAYWALDAFTKYELALAV